MSQPDANVYANPTRNCDLVMKGGVTSGVVYPLTACRLARTFRFRNIGGTSAGAIAAAATAAAEVRRQRGSSQGGFAELEELPNFLMAEAPSGSGTNLLNFFQPQRTGKGVFQTALAALGGGCWPGRVLWAACKAFPVALFIGLLPGIVLFTEAVRHSDGRSRALFMACAGALAVAGGLIALVSTFSIRAIRALKSNDFGLCSGMPGTPSGTPSSLTVWLTSYLNRLAGLDAAGDPLTFEHLWGTRDSTRPRIVNLEMMTTCLSLGRPFRLPFRDDDQVRDNRQFYFQPEELARLFPDHVVRWMVDHPRSVRGESSAARRVRLAKLGFHPLPDPADLPVVVAVRMSLSFPILLSAVPLHVIEFRTDHDEQPRRCWFSDGGLSSNFPMHFFDAPMPRWPTFGIDLDSRTPGRPPGVWMPTSNSLGSLSRWFDLDDGSAFDRFEKFLGALLSSTKDWVDNTQAQLPGFRDRIAHIALDVNDGGLNLNMPKGRIKRLSRYGARAGEELERRFSGSVANAPLGWPNHRWIRLRGALAAMEELLLKIDRGCANPEPGDIGYEPWLADASAVPPSYPWSNDGQRKLAQEALSSLRTLAGSLKTAQERGVPNLQTRAPRPRPELRARTRI